MNKDTGTLSKMNSQMASIDRRSEDIGHDDHRSVADSAYGGYETLRSILIDDEAVIGNQKGLEEVRIEKTISLITASGGDGIFAM